MNRNRILLLLTALAFGSSEAFATTTLKQVQVSNGSQVDLLFDGKISKSQIKTEFFNDVVQISLSDVSVYPAKISSVNGGNLTKIFAYQYAPKLVRCRLSVKGKAEAYKDQLTITPGGPNGKMLTVRFGGVAKAPALKGEDAQEQALLERVLKTTAPREVEAAKDSANADQIVEKTAAPVRAPDKVQPMVVASAGESPGNSPGNSEDKPLNFGHENARGEKTLTGAKNLPSPLSAFGKLAFVVGLFALIALGVKKFWKGGKLESDNAVMGAIGRFARKNLGTRNKLIEVVANHYLGPKKSIAVVKVGGRTLVVGITDQSINLISQLSSEEDAMNALVEMDNPPLDEVIKAPVAPPIPTRSSGTGATAAGPATFSKILQGESVRPQAGPGTGNQVAQTKMATSAVKDVRVTSYGSGLGGFTGNARVSSQDMSPQAALGLSGVRAQIKSKLEGLKQI